MSQEAPSPTDVEQTWSEIDRALEELGRLARSDVPPREFYVALLDRTVTALAAVGGAAWVRRDDGQFHLEYQIRLERTGLLDDAEARSAHRRTVESVIDTGRSLVLPPQSGTSADGDASNPTDFLLLAAAAQTGAETVALVELFQRADGPPSAWQGYRDVLEAVCALAADFHLHRQVRRLQDREELWGRFERFAETVHASPDVEGTVYAIANDGRTLSGCDRVSVLVRRSSRYRTAAVSGVERVERRANAVRALERLCAAVLSAKEPLWYSGGNDGLPPQIAEPLHAYLDESHARSVAVLPLESRDETHQRRADVIGGLVVERFDADWDAEFTARADAVARHGSLALRNALAYESVPLRPIWRSLSATHWWRRMREAPAAVLLLIALLAVLVALCVVPEEFEIEARGLLQPVVRRDVFAPTDGIVADDLPIEHEQPVRRGDLLVVLRSPALDLEFQRVWG
ncbi:MAG: GAF domain-containing protein, partial [Planctomycetaceae bacterium]